MKNSVFWDVTVPRVLSIYANVIFAILWVGFIAALMVNKERFDTLWVWVQALPLAPRIIVWLVFLPIMVGLWIWESSWSTFGQVLGFIGIVGWTLVSVFNLIKAYRR